MVFCVLFCCCMCCFFFFSSRRRHTRLQGDWSSDVCSSDLWRLYAVLLQRDVRVRCRHFHIDRKSTRLNSSHLVISYAVFCLKKKKKPTAHCTRPASCSTRPATPTSTRATPCSPAARAGEMLSCSLACPASPFLFFFFNDTATTEIYPLSLHDALPI